MKIASLLLHSAAVAAGLSGCLYLLAPAAASDLAATALPDLFSTTPRETAPSTTVATMPPNTFLENLLVDGRGRVFVTSHEEGRIYRLDGAALVGFSKVQGKIAGIAPRPGGGFVVSGTDQAGLPTVFSVQEDGRAAPIISLPAAMFLNGVEALGDDEYLVADSYLGAIWRVNAAAAKATLWLKHPLLERVSTASPFPAANGVRRGDGAVWISNTARQLMLRVPLLADRSAGEPAVVHSRVNVDDFAVLPDGSLLAATHVYNSVIRIDRFGRTTEIAGATDGMVGSTAVALASEGGGAQVAYVTTNGGMFLPPPGGVQPARVVRIQLQGSPQSVLR